MPTPNCAWRASNVILGTLPGKLIVKDRSRSNWKNGVKVQDLLLIFYVVT